eukprot:1152939-Rhodomonas_salina.2
MVPFKLTLSCSASHKVQARHTVSWVSLQADTVHSRPRSRHSVHVWQSVSAVAEHSCSMNSPGAQTLQFRHRVSLARLHGRAIHIPAGHSSVQLEHCRSSYSTSPQNWLMYSPATTPFDQPQRRALGVICLGTRGGDIVVGYTIESGTVIAVGIEGPREALRENELPFRTLAAVLTREGARLVGTERVGVIHKHPRRGAGFTLGTHSVGLRRTRFCDVRAAVPVRGAAATGLAFGVAELGTFFRQISRKGRVGVCTVSACRAVAVHSATSGEQRAVVLDVLPSPTHVARDALGSVNRVAAV